MLKDYSFVVTSFNGKERLQVLCEWFERNKFKGELIIVSADYENERKLFDYYSFVKFIHHPNCTPNMGQYLGFKEVTSKYCSILGDDDLPIFETFQKICTFLDSNPEFIGGYGPSGYIDYPRLQECVQNKSQADMRFKVKSLLSDRYDGQAFLASQKPIARLTKFRENYLVTHFIVTRSSIAKEIYNKRFGAISNDYLSEYASCYAHVALGKTKFLPHLYLLRGIGYHRREEKLEGGAVTFDVNRHIEKEISSYVNDLKLPVKLKEVVFPLIISKHYGAIVKGLTDHRQNRGITAYFKHILRRLVFILSYQSTSRLKLLNWKDY